MAPGSPPPVRTLPPAWDSSATRDAPHTTGMLGTVGEPRNYPRGESKRVLPPSKEPGIWASDRAVATADALVERHIVAIGVVTPPELIGNIAEEYTPTQWCRLVVGSHLHSVADVLHAQPLAKDEELNCFAAKIMRHCLKAVAKADVSMDSQPVPAAFPPLATKADRKMASVEKNRCGKIDTSGVDDLLRRVVDGWAVISGANK